MAAGPWLHPELAEALGRVPPEALPHHFLDFSDMPASRARSAARRPQLAALDSVATEDLTIPGPQGAPDLRMRVYRPKGQQGPLPGLYYIHGGGMIMGTHDGDDLRMSSFVDDAGCVLTSIDYRLAPENPHPAPVEDCYAGLVWVAANAERLGIETAKLAIGGASAGGGLAAATALLARDRGGPKLIYQLLIYPMLDHRNVTPASHEITSVGIWDRQTNLDAWRAYIGELGGDDDVSPYASPTRAADLSGLPPAFVDVGTADLFRDEDIEYAQRLMQAGVPTELIVYPGAFHGFEGFAPKSSFTAAVWKGRMAALRRAFESA